MKVLVRYNDSPDPNHHSTIVINTRTLLRRATAKDILKKFVKSYNNVMKLGGYELKAKELHLAIRQGNDPDYIALPSDILISSCIEDHEEADDGSNNTYLFVRHGRAKTQASFLLQMKDHIRSALQTEVFGPTPKQVSPMVDADDDVVISIVDHPNEVEQRNDGDDTEPLMANLETLDTAVSTDEQALAPLISTEEITDAVREENDKLTTSDIENLPQEEAPAPSTTWVQFKKVMHSFGVDSVVYQEVLDEIKREKAMQVQQYRDSEDIPEDDPLIDQSVKNHMGNVFTKNFVEMRKKKAGNYYDQDLGEEEEIIINHRQLQQKEQTKQRAVDEEIQESNCSAFDSIQSIMKEAGAKYNEMIISKKIPFFGICTTVAE